MSRLNINRRLDPTGKTKPSSLLYGAMKANGVRCYEIESKLGVSATTLRKWLRVPGRGWDGQHQETRGHSRLVKNRGMQRVDLVDAVGEN